MTLSNILTCNCNQLHLDSDLPNTALTLSFFSDTKLLVSLSEYLAALLWVI